MSYERIEAEGLIFDCRPNTSDEKSVREVISRKGYARRDFRPADGEKWLDIGCNIGAFAVWAASFGATVNAYEPDPENAELARHNIQINGLSRYATVHEIALTADDKIGAANFYRNTARGNLWRNSLYKEWRGGETITVPTHPIDELWTKEVHIKLDAEGVEMPILERYAATPVKRLVFEWSFDIDPSITRYNAVIDTLSKHYRVRSAKLNPGFDTWQPEWFPPCRTVWCD